MLKSRRGLRPATRCCASSTAAPTPAPLFDAIGHLPGACHLTTLMCAEHRRDVLARVRDDLAGEQPVRLVATSLIEAGVDIDFPEVWRAAAGLDSIAQAAGRCNRGGRLDGLGRTVIFEPADRNTPPAIRVFYQAARPVLRAGGDPLSLHGFHQYFRELYFNQGHAALDAARLDGENYAIIEAIGSARRAADFPFARIAQAFRLIDNVMDSVLIPWDDEAKGALAALEYAAPPSAGVVRRLQQYIVLVPSKVRRALLTAGAAHAIKAGLYGDRFVVLDSMELYDDRLGLRLERRPRSDHFR